MEEVLHCLLLCAVAINEVFARAAENNLASNRYLGIFFEADGRFCFIAVVEDYSDTGFGDACLTALVDEVLKGQFALDICVVLVKIRLRAQAIPADSPPEQCSYS